MHRLLLTGAIAAGMATIATPALMQAQTPIRNLTQVNGITIQGRVLSVVGNSFTLEDGTGEVIVDAGPQWWQEINITPGQQVMVVGEVDRGGEFEAFQITREDGSVVEIRSPEGPPPWAGGPNRDR